MECVFTVKGLDSHLLEFMIFTSTPDSGLALAPGEKAAVKYNIGTLGKIRIWIVWQGPMLSQLH